MAWWCGGAIQYLYGTYEDHSLIMLKKLTVARLGTWNLDLGQGGLGLGLCL